MPMTATKNIVVKQYGDNTETNKGDDEIESNNGLSTEHDANTENKMLNVTL